MNPTFMAIVPCYNEEGRVGATLQALLNHVDRVCVIDDGSTDNSVKEIEQFPVNVISYPQNKGKGYAIREGIKYFLQTDTEYAIFIDADGQHNPEHIYQFKQKFAHTGVDVVVASRFGTEQWVNNMPFLRKLSNLLSRFGIWILYNGFVVEDPQNGYRAYNRSSLEHIAFESNGYEAETEIIIDAYLKGFTFDKIHIESIYHEGVNHSKFSLFRDTWKIPGVMVKNFFRRKPFILRTNGQKLTYRRSSLDQAK
ncbi:MAG: glycosyltransferase family 2 protein [Candidatus Heimdallarchaeota archaeon]|nr:glycosyltransferase family 2 protein [Candidatus Heimdallarchaeota archaeon]